MKRDGPSNHNLHMTSSYPCRHEVYTNWSLRKYSFRSSCCYCYKDFAPLVLWASTHAISCANQRAWILSLLKRWSVWPTWFSALYFLLRPRTLRQWPTSAPRSSHRRGYFSFWVVRGHPKTCLWVHHIFDASYQTSPWIDAPVHLSRNDSTRYRIFCEHCLVHDSFSPLRSLGPCPLNCLLVRSIPASWRDSLRQSAISSPLSRYRCSHLTHTCTISAFWVSFVTSLLSQ